MKILILNWRDINHPLSGGAEIVTYEHAKGWVERGHTVTWFTSWYKEAKRNETKDGIHMIRRGGSLTVYLAAIQYVMRYGDQFDVIVDEVHGFPFFSPVFTKTPVVVFIHEIAGVIWDFMYPFPINKIGRFIESWYCMLYKKSLFWTDAKSTIDELVEKGVSRKQCTAIPCPIRVNERVIKEDEFIQKEPNPTYIFVSRVVKMKGIDEVIKAFAFIRKEQPDAALWIVGGGEPEYIRALKLMVSEYQVKKHVTFFGKVTEKEKFRLLRKAHILLHASVKEGWGLVVLEAALVRTPSIVYNVEGLRDVVKNNKTGIVLSENSPKEMAKQALILWTNKIRYKSFQNEGVLWVRSLKWKTVIDQSEKLLQKESGILTTSD